MARRCEGATKGVLGADQMTGRVTQELWVSRCLIGNDKPFFEDRREFRFTLGPPRHLRR